ncbi:uncharacterized protein LOC126249435 [Schistocerca nitens]|uniref:uncharacterized protein LOC126249435 n=1 Tax=Schistocerca nitens TaxID=7011 RepID=UPI0021180CD3|nr:uncharacterized protein LOC126249435 [Schistocerca nitens]
MARALLASLSPLIIALLVAAAPRLFDMPEIPERRMMSQAGDNITLDCPGVTDMSLVLQLEWWAKDMKLVQYSDAGTTVWENRRRITLRKDNFALEIHPVIAEDDGRYTCLVNSRPRPEAYIMLQVQEFTKDSHELDKQWQ